MRIRDEVALTKEGATFRIETANEKALLRTLSGSKAALVCTPFFTRDGLDLIEKALNAAAGVDLLLRANIYDWATGYADLGEMHGFLRHLLKAKVVPSLFVISNLHAKIYAGITRKRAYFGSANLSKSAFQSNLEIMTFTQGPECDPILRIVDEIKAKALPISLENFGAIVDVTKETVRRAMKASKLALEGDADFETAVQLFSSELQKLVLPRRPATKPKRKRISPDKDSNYVPLPKPWPSIDEFISYCSKSRVRIGSEIVDRYRGKSNLQGHIKHVFFGSLFFFYEHPSIISQISTELARREHVPWSAEPWVPIWKAYLGRHQGEFYKDISFNYHTLITYLPTSLGGVQQSGGATSGNLKMVISMLAKMMKERLK